MGGTTENKSKVEVNKILLSSILIAVIAISPTLVLAKSEVAGGYQAGFARGVEEAHKAIAQFNNEQISTIDGNKRPLCPLADKQDDYCDGWKDGWEKTIVKELD
jgi:hypothetical protein